MKYFLTRVEKNIYKLVIKKIKQKKLFVFWKIKSEFYLYKKLQRKINSYKQAIINYIFILKSLYNIINTEEIEDTIS
jgi:hypothetical protein